MSFLLDTCVVSELIRPRPAKGVVQWLEAAGEAELHLSVLTLGELYKGIAKLRDAVTTLNARQPAFFSVTYGAGGSTRELTHDLVVRIKEAYGTIEGDEISAMDNEAEAS